MDQPQPNTIKPGPSRDMLGGPWLGLLVFVAIAIVMGWGVAKFFQAASDMAQSLDETAGHGFEPDQLYTLKQDLLLGYTADGRKVLFPPRDTLPPFANGRNAVPTLEQARTMSPEELGQADLIGVVAQGTPVRFVDLFIKPPNTGRGADMLVKVEAGPFASRVEALGMHLESVETDETTGARRYTPREDLFTPVEAKTGQVQSDAQTDAQE